MPWCDECAKFWSPNSLPASGACPRCGRVLTGRPATSTSASPAAGSGADSPGDGTAEDEEEYRAPWHFKLMIALAAVYLTWRFIQVVSWFV